MNETLLQIDRIDFPAFSARGCHQTLQPLKSGELRRTVNGELCYLGHQIHHKYVSIIRCSDQFVPPFENFWRGEEITISCLQRLCQKIVGDGETKTFNLERPGVPGSERVAAEDGQEILLYRTKEQSVIFAAPPEKGKIMFVSYRPFLKMRVTSFHLETDEWGGKISWRLNLEEI